MALPTSSAPSNADSAQNWADQVADLVVETVDKVRDKTVVPAQKASRGVAYGVAIPFLAIPAIVMLLVLLVRVLDKAIPGDVWFVYALFGIIFIPAGVAVWVTKYSDAKP